MSAPRDLDRQIQSFLAEGPMELPDASYDEVRDRMEHKRQRAFIGPWRTPDVNNVLKVGLAAAAVVVAAVLGLTYLNNQVGTDPPTPTPTLTADPTATPVGIPPLPPFGAGSLVAGQYTIAVPDSPVVAAITIGDGWTTGGWYIMDPPRFTKQVSFWTVENVYRDWCDPESLPSPAIGPTVDDLVEAFGAQANTDMSTAVDVEVGGFAGKRVTLQLVDLVLCNDMDKLSYFVTPGGGPGRNMEPGHVDTLWIIDVNGHRVVIVASQADPVDSIATTSIAGVIDSIEFVDP